MNYNYDEEEIENLLNDYRERKIKRRQLIEKELQASIEIEAELSELAYYGNKDAARSIAIEILKRVEIKTHYGIL